MGLFGLGLVWARYRPAWLEDRESLLVSVLIRLQIIRHHYRILCSESQFVQRLKLYYYLLPRTKVTQSDPTFLGLFR